MKLNDMVEVDKKVYVIAGIYDDSCLLKAISSRHPDITLKAEVTYLGRVFDCLGCERRYEDILEDAHIYVKELGFWYCGNCNYRIVQRAEHDAKVDGVSYTSRGFYKYLGRYA
jgi:hypothetical protein